MLKLIYSNITIKFLFCFLLITIGQSISYSQNDWINYKADAVLSFSVDVPAEMEYISKTIKTAVGELTTHTYIHQGSEKEPNYLYVINIIEYPYKTFDSDSLELINTFLEESVQTVARSVGGEVIYASKLDISPNGNGILYRVKYNDNTAIIKGKSFINQDVYINLQVFTTKDNSLNDEMNTFLDSFKTLF